MTITSSARPATATRVEPPKTAPRRRRRLWIATGVVYLVTFVILLPLLWILLLSFRRSDDILAHPFSLSNFTADNYRTVVKTLDLIGLIATIVTLLN